MNTTNTTNPFQVPTCLQRATLQQRRQARIKKIVIGSIAATTVLLVFLLVEGCMSEHAKSAALGQEMVVADSGTVPAPEVPAVAPKPAVIAQPKPVTPPAVVASPLRDAKSRVLSGSETFYVVKSGDTLARIAKQHRLAVKTLMAMNNLNDDKLVVGTKLKLPTV